MSGTDRIITGDAFDVLDDLPEESVHAIVTDPPYGEGDYTGGFMGREWDQFDGPRAFQEWNREWAEKAKRVLKPGGHLLAFGSNDGHHRATSGIEDAGFEIRDHIAYHFANGFPKGLNVSKAIDKQADAEREVVDEEDPRSRYDGADREFPATYAGVGDGDGSGGLDGKVSGGHSVTAPATDAAKRWDGWQTALKPATEFIILARKLLSEGTVAENVLEHGTGALNIDGCRIDTERPIFESGSGDSETCYGDGLHGSEEVGSERGRYPANVVFDEPAAGQLDLEVGELRSPDPYDHDCDPADADLYGNGREAGSRPGYGDTGGPSRYFYTSKASRSERTEGGTIQNDHPTVKPLDLMEWLIKLVTREEQVVLDPFAGSGTTCKAAKDLGRRFIGIEKQPKWADVARVRCGLSPDDPSHVRDDDDQAGMEAFLTDGSGRNTRQDSAEVE